MAQQIKNISIPVEIDTVGREVIGQQIIDFIQARTRRGLDINNKPFKGYSDSYKESDDFSIAGKSNTVNLELTGDMMSDLQLISHTPGNLRIGYENGTEENEKAEYNRAPRVNPQTRKVAPKRDFLGLTDADLDRIVGRYLARNPIVQEAEVTQAQREARALLNKIFNTGE